MRKLFRLVVLLVLAAVLYVFADHLWPQPMARFAINGERFAAGLKPHQITIDGVDWRYLDSGARGGDTVVLLHGFGADKDNFTPAAIFLRKAGRIIAPDLPGFGDSARPAGASYTIEAQAENLHRFLDALDLPRVHLGGSSMGGAIAVEFARRYPARVASLWLLAPAGVASAKESEMIRSFKATGESPLIAHTPEAFAQVFDLALSKPPPAPYSVKRELALRAVADAELHTQIFKQMVTTLPALEQSAASLATPALIVWGEEDRVLDVSGASILHQALAGSQMMIMPGIGHLPMLEAPQAAARDYLRFRSTIPPPAPAADPAPAATSSAP